MLYFTRHQSSVRVALLFVLFVGSVGWAIADAPPVITAPKALTSCRPTFFNGCLTGGVNSLTVNGITLSNASGCSTGYTSHTAVITNVTPGQSYSFAGTFTNTNPYHNGVTIWADINRDGVFDAVEMVYQAPAAVITSGFSGSLTIPNNTAAGSVDMRVVVAHNTVPAGSGACGTYSYGEAEDYVLTVLAPTTYNPTTTGIGSTSAVLNWNNLGTASSYDVQWRPAGGTYTTITGITSTSYALTGLTLGTPYDWQMRPTGGSYVGPVSFTTASCSTPTNLGAYSTGATSTFLQWSIPSEASYPNKVHEVQIQVTGAGSWSGISGINPFSRIGGLTPQTAYTWRVRADCSVFSTPQTFTTTSCNAPSVSSANTISHNAVQIPWFDNEPRTYSLQYRPVGSSTWATVPGLTTSPYTLTGLVVNTAYQYALNKVCTGSISSTYSAPQTFTTVCNPLYASFPYTDQILSSAVRLRWDDYTPGVLPAPVQVQWRPTSTTGAAWNNIDNVSGVRIGNWTSVYNLTGLTNNTAYEWQARNTCAVGVYGAFTSPSSFTTQSCQPPTLSGAFSIGINRATVSWFTNTPHDGQTYAVRWRPASSSAVTTGWTSVSGLTATSYSLTGLSPAVNYEWQVSKACSQLESSAFTNSSSFTTLACVNTINSLSEGAITFSAATLTWFDNNLNTHTLQWRPVTMPVSAWSSFTLPTPAFGVQYSLTGLATSTVYEWQLATNCTASQSSTFTVPRSFTTTGCQNFVSSPFVLATSFNAVTLNWSGPAYVPYTIHYRQAGTTTWTDAPMPVTRPYTLSGLTATTAYQFEIASVCSTTQNSVYSNTVSFTASGCINPAGTLSTTLTSFNSTQLTWSGFTTNAYDLRWRQSSTATWNNVTGINTRPYLLTGLNATTSYEWQLAAVCGPGQNSAYSSSNTFLTTACSNVATGLTATGAAFNAENLNWTDPTNTPQNLRWRAVGSISWNDVPGISRPYTLTGLTASTAYEWQLATACTSAVSSTYTGSSLFTTLASGQCPVMYTVKDGSWDDPTVWVCNRVPLVTDAVQVKHQIAVPGGYLAYALKISFDTGSKLVYGTASRLQLNQ